MSAEHGRGCVLDASVVVALYATDPLSGGANAAVAALQAAEARFHAPELLLHEVSNAFRQAARRGELTTEECLERIGLLSTTGVVLHPASALAQPALSLALAHDISAYDAAYLALALKLDARLLTGDQRFAARARATGVSLELIGSTG